MSSARWRDDPRGPYIRLHSGRRFYLLHPDLESFHVPDVAYHLARINRYTGASEISIAQHCVMAAQLASRLYPREATLPGAMLVHDVAEFAYGDVSSPLKSLLPEYKSLEVKANRAVETRFGVVFIHKPLVKEIDDRLWLTESRQLFGDAAREDYQGPLEPVPMIIPRLTPAEAEAQWLAMLKRCLPWVKHE